MIQREKYCPLCDPFQIFEVWVGMGIAFNKCFSIPLGALASIWREKMVLAIPPQTSGSFLSSTPVNKIKDGELSLWKLCRWPVQAQSCSLSNRLWLHGCASFLRSVVGRFHPWIQFFYSQIVVRLHPRVQSQYSIPPYVSLGTRWW